MTLFATKREISASPAAVFAAIADPARLAKWWGPNGFTNTFDAFDFQSGGKWVFSMHGPDGKIYPNESIFRAISPGSKVVIEHVSHPHFQLSITLQELQNGTLVHWEQAFNDAAVAEALRHIVEPANEQNLDRLTAEVLSHKSSAA